MLSALLAPAPARAQPAEQKHVLILWGGRVDLPVNDVVNRAIRTTLYEEFGSGVDFRFEFVEEASDPRDQTALRDFLRSKYTSQRFDLVIPIATWAISFAHAYAGELFPGAPVLCWGASSTIDTWPPDRRHTSVGFTLDARPTVEFILRAQPNVRRLVLVAGGSVHDDADHLARVRQALREYEGRLAVTYLIGRSLEDVKAEVARLPDDSAILYVSMHGDATGRRLVNVDAMASIAQVARAPVYVLVASNVGAGALGGVVGSQQALAEETGRVAIRILKGARVEDIPPVDVPLVPMADWRQLRRWGVPEERLPPGTVLLNREPSVWEAYRWRILGVAALCAAQAALIAALLVQLTRRRRAEGLRGAVLASLHDHVAILDASGSVVETNESWRRFAEENGPGVVSHPLPPASCLESWSAGNGSVDEFRRRARAGLEAVLAGREPRFRLEHPCPTPSGERWFAMSVEPLRRREGGAVITHSDITARRDAEHAEQEQHRQLAHLGRVAVLGEMTGTLAHELNQPLTAIMSNAQAARLLLAADAPDIAELRETIDDIVTADRRAGDVIRRLHRMLKRADAQLNPVEVNEVVREVVDLAHGDLVARGVKVSMRLRDGLPPVSADRVQLQQVLLNLILNGCDAMTAVADGAKELTVTSDRDGDGRVEVRVRDRGTGIPIDDVERIFEPFVTSKQKGLGLGLAISRSIATAHGGRLWATNNEGDGGATLHLALPGRDAPRLAAGA